VVNKKIKTETKVSSSDTGAKNRGGVTSRRRRKFHSWPRRPYKSRKSTKRREPGTSIAEQTNRESVIIEAKAENGLETLLTFRKTDVARDKSPKEGHISNLLILCESQ